MRILITGISGGIGRRLAERLLREGHEVCGIDRRPWPDAPQEIEVFRADVRKRPAEDLFRSHRPEAVIHMATVTHLSARREERYRNNLQGTRILLEHCQNYGVKQLLFISRHTIYGAAQDAPLYRKESEPPLAASTFPNLADLVAADLYAGSAIWRFPQIKTAVLRVVYTLGPSERGPLSNLLSTGRVPMVLGFDPLFQFLHEYDAAEAILCALSKGLHGVFNVAGSPPVPLSLLIRVTGRRALPIPEPLFPKLLGHFGLPRLPIASCAHLKYPIVVDCRAFKAASGFEARLDETQVMEAYRWLH